MIRYGKGIAAILLLFLVTAAGIWLPSKLFAVRDEQKMRDLKSQDGGQIVVQSNAQIPFEEKFELIYKRTLNIRLISVASKEGEGEKIVEIAESEISELCRMGALPKRMNKIAEIHVLQRFFAIDTEEPEIFLYFWLVKVRSKSGTEVFLGIEEESGRVLTFDLWSLNKKLRPAKLAQGFITYLQSEMPFYPGLDEEKYFIAYNDECCFSTGKFSYDRFQNCIHSSYASDYSYYDTDDWMLQDADVSTAGANWRR